MRTSEMRKNAEDGKGRSGASHAAVRPLPSNDNKNFMLRLKVVLPFATPVTLTLNPWWAYWSTKT